jgi:hypothetical protein
MAASVSPNLARLLAFGITVWLALAGAVAIGSWRHARGPVNEDPERLETIDGFTTYSVPSAGFRIALPESWMTFRAQDVFGESEAELERFARENPEFGGLTEALTDPRSPMKLVGFDPETHADFATNMNVVVENVPEGLSFDMYAQATEDALRSVGSIGGDLESKTVQLRAGPARQFSYEAQFTIAGQTQPVATLQYVFVAKGRGYVLSYATLPELADRYRDDFERSAGSFSASN